MKTMTDNLIPATTASLVRVSFADRDFVAGNFVVDSQNQNKSDKSQDDNRIPTGQTPPEVPAA